MSWKSVRHPHLYEINTRLFLRSISTGETRATLDDIPDQFWQDLADRGIHWVWLMGVWNLVEKDFDPHLIPDVMMDEFRDLLPDLSQDDIDGSPYAIDSYTVDPKLGGDEALARVRAKLNALGIGLMLDFIPNHFGAHSRWIKSNPEYFIELDAREVPFHTNTFYQPSHLGMSRHFAHGKHPYFDAWQDTVQVDFSKESARSFMTDQLSALAEMCDGVRCDMAMLVLPETFNKTWGEWRTWEGDAYWRNAIEKVKSINPGFKLMAEVYWDMEIALMSLGFDYCYDKIFYDRLTEPSRLRAHFNAEPGFLNGTCRFLENHDEQRAAARLSFDQHMAAAALVAFGPGMRFWHMGQWDGWRHKIPVQLTRGPVESCQCLLCAAHAEPNGCAGVRQLYEGLFRLANNEILHNGTWRRLDVPGLVAWQWSYSNQKMVVMINYSEHVLNVDIEPLARKMSMVFPSAAHSEQPLRKIWPWGLCVWQTS